MNIFTTIFWSEVSEYIYRVLPGLTKVGDQQ